MVATVRRRKRALLLVAMIGLGGRPGARAPLAMVIYSPQCQTACQIEIDTLCLFAATIFLWCMFFVLILLLAVLLTIRKYRRAAAGTGNSKRTVAQG